GLISLSESVRVREAEGAAWPRWTRGDELSESVRVREIEGGVASVDTWRRALPDVRYADSACCKRATCGRDRPARNFQHTRACSRVASTNARPAPPDNRSAATSAAPP